MSDNVELFRLTSEEHDSFEGKSLNMLKHLIDRCESLYFTTTPDGDIDIVFEKLGEKNG